MHNLYVIVTDKNDEDHSFIKVSQVDIYENYLSITHLDGSYFAFHHNNVKSFSVEDYKENA